jgi:CcmD family protein
MDNFFFLFSAYSVAWIGISIYVFLNTRKQRMIEKKIDDLESMLRKG